MRFLAFLGLLAACSAPPVDDTISGFVDPGAVFVLERLDGAEFPARATITFPGAGKVLGEAPCNRWSAPQELPHPRVAIGPILSTRRSCADQPLETAFFEALRAMRTIEATGNVVIFGDDAGREMVFRAEN